jgi:hypothetical protein
MTGTKSEVRMFKKVFAIVSVAICAGLFITFAPQLLRAEKAFASVRAAPADDTEAKQPLAQRSCDDFEFWFLNPTCSKVRAKHAARTKHHAATFVSGNSASGRIASAKR